MKVYHGTISSHAIDIGKNGIDLSRSKRYLDFGRGFYTTPDYEMAKNMAYRALECETRKRKGTNYFPAIISFEYQYNPLLIYRQFEYEDIEWAKFILSNRLPINISEKLGLMEHNFDQKYDIIIGGTADGSVADIASRLRFGQLKPQEYCINLSDFLKRDGSSYGKQIVFCSEKALSCIKYIKYDNM